MPSPETLPYNPEAAHSAERLRNPFVEAIVEHSKGTFGVLTFANFDTDEKSQMRSMMSERGSTPPADVIERSGGGSGNYGERPLEANGDIQMVNGQMVFEQGLDKADLESNERLHFIDLGDGTVDVRYRFKAPGYTIDNRPNNLRVGFIIPEKEAKQLHEAVSRDPRTMDQLLEAQMNAIGIAGEAWEKIKPRYGYDPYNSGEQIMGLDDDKRRTVIFEHNADGSVKEREEVVLGEAKEQQKITANIETDATAKQTLEAMKVYITTARGQGVELDKIPNPYDYEDLKGVSQDVYDAAEAVLDSNAPYGELEMLLETAKNEY